MILLPRKTRRDIFKNLETVGGIVPHFLDPRVKVMHGALSMTFENSTSVYRLLYQIKWKKDRISSKMNFQNSQLPNKGESDKIWGHKTNYF